MGKRNEMGGEQGGGREEEERVGGKKRIIGTSRERGEKVGGGGTKKKNILPPIFAMFPFLEIEIFGYSLCPQVNTGLIHTDTLSSMAYFIKP